jgi:CheY-like chemotaxis protein
MTFTYLDATKSVNLGRPGGQNPPVPSPAPRPQTTMTEVKRILIVENDPNDVKLVLTALDKCQLAREVIVTADGVEAMEYLLGQGKYSAKLPGNPALVILDLKMPRVGGLDVLRQIRSHESLRMIPVVMFTSSRQDRDLQESYKLGANAYVVKPVDFHEFERAILELGIFWARINEAPPGSVKCPK